MDEAVLLQQIRDKILNVTSQPFTDLDNAVYLQQIRDAILGITLDNSKYGNLDEAIYLQQIRDAILGVTIDNSKYGSLDNAIYLQQIRDAYNGITARVQGGMDDDIYLAEILGVAGPPGPLFESPSYANAGGTGNRTAEITVTSTLTSLFGLFSLLVDGDTVNGMFWSAEPVAGKEIVFDFGTQRLITEMKFYKDPGYAGGLGTWKIQISNNGIAWTDIGNPFVLADVPLTQTITAISTNTTGARYYRLFGIAGNTAVLDEREFEFKIGNPLP